MHTPHSPGEGHTSTPTQWNIGQCPSCGEILLTLTDVDTGISIRTKLPTVAIVDAMIESLDHARSALVARDASKN